MGVNQHLQRFIAPLALKVACGCGIIATMSIVPALILPLLPQHEPKLERSFMRDMLCTARLGRHAKPHGITS